MDRQARIAVLTKLFGYFKNAVSNSKPVQEYISGRSLEKEKLQIGYNSSQFHHGSRKDQALIESCIVFALRNNQNQITGLYFRSIIDNKNSRHFYLKGRQGLYSKYPDPETKRLILTESIIDCATLLQQKMKGYEVLALYGTNGLTNEHIKVIQELQITRDHFLFKRR